MTSADDLQPLPSNAAIWHAFDPAVKAELFSTALPSPRGTLLVDPIPLAAPAVEGLLALGPIGGIVVTNTNHWRASAAWAGRFGVPVYGHDSLASEAGAAFESVKAGDEILGAARVIAIEGGVSGEIALHLPEQNGSLILGDALIHFEPYGFTFLPAKYCTNHKLMRRSLRQLLDYKSERILFAHGTPILANGKSRLENLLHGD